jgi:uncharacterized protein (DUF885 family)
MNSITRRCCLSHVAAALAAGATGCTHTTTEKAMTSAHALIDDVYAALLAEAPHDATAYGLDHGPFAHLRGGLPNRSLAARDSRLARYELWRKRLEFGIAEPAVPRDDLDVLRHVVDLGIEGTRFGFGDAGVMSQSAQENTPYVVNQMVGGIVATPQVLASQQPLADQTDLDAFQQRWAAMANLLDQETEALQHDAARGACAPRFILQALLRQIDGFLAEPAPRQRVVLALAQVAAQRGWHPAVSQAERSYEQAVKPAALRQREIVLQLVEQADDAAGVHRLPDGERYYAWALRVATGAALGADEVHALGLEQQAAIGSRMEALLRAQGLSQGSVGQRMAALAADERHRFANTDAGRVEAIAYCNRFIERVRELMPKLSNLALKAAVRVERVPPAIESGQAGAYMSPGPLDGSRPSVFYLNLRDTAAWPRWALPTLVAHEALPGHAWQEGFELERARRHAVRALIKFNSFSEGWALYAETLVDEAGLYADDPLARLGYLQAQMLRATRLVVDTGLHVKRWTREEAVQSLAGATGRPLAAVGGEIDRYCVKPGQACGYMIGQLELLSLREQWRRQRGPRFDLPTFNDAVLEAGQLPLAQLSRRLKTQA